MRIARWLGVLWALPFTLLGTVFALLFVALGWSHWIGVRDSALLWASDDEAFPSWLWFGRSAIVLGNIVVIRYWAGEENGCHHLRHQQEHVRQWTTLGPLMPVLWFTSWLTLVLAQHANPRYDHPMEIDARRAAGQVVDVIGALKALAHKKHKT